MQKRRWEPPLTPFPLHMHPLAASLVALASPSRKSQHTAATLALQGCPLHFPSALTPRHAMPNLAFNRGQAEVCYGPP